MNKSKWHENLQDKIAKENNGITEFITPEGLIIDVKLSDRSIEIEKKPTQKSICTAIKRLETQPGDKKEIIVKKELDKIKEKAQSCESSYNILIKNPSRTKMRLVKAL